MGDRGSSDSNSNNSNNSSKQGRIRIAELTETKEPLLERNFSHYKTKLDAIEKGNFRINELEESNSQLEASNNKLLEMITLLKIDIEQAERKIEQLNSEREQNYNRKEEKDITNEDELTYLQSKQKNPQGGELDE
jgi:predicted nuclease with TOPRIM domain